MSGTPSGRQYPIVNAEQRAVIVELGAGLRSYRAGSADVVDGYRRNEPSEGGRGQLLLPWPNRVAAGRYVFGGRELQLTVNDTENRVCDSRPDPVVAVDARRCSH